MRIDSPISSNAQITGSFTGSFKGDGSLLAGVTAEWDGSHNGNASITGSLNVSSDIIVGGTVDGVDVALLNSNYSLTSASAASNTAAIAALDSTYATDSELSSLSGSAHTDRVAKVAALSGSAHTQRVAIESGLSSDISSLSGSAHTDRVAKVAALSGSAHTQRTAISGALASSIGLKAPLESPTFTGTVSGVTATHVGLGNVTNESKATMFSSPTFTGTVSGVTATHVGLGNVTNESKATMFTDAALTGNPTAPTQTGTDDSTKIATTAFVQGRIDEIIGTAGSTLDTLGELSASLAQDSGSLASLVTTVGGKLQKDQNLSDLTDASAARTNLGVDTKANTWTGISGDITITSLGVATVADDSHNHIIANVDGLQAALDAKQASGTYNTIIGTDTDLDTSGAEVVDQINVTDGVIQSMSKRTMTLANLGYTGATDANNYTHPSYTARSIDTTGAEVLDVFTSDTSGHVTSITKRTMTLADLGYTGATNANNYAITQDNTSNVHFEGLMVGQTTGATANTIRCIGDVVAYYSSDAQFKDNVETLEGALDKIKAIRGVRFDWNDKQDVYEGHDIGVIAQEVEAVLPELVHHREYNDSKAVDYAKLTAVLIQAVKELSAKVDELSK